MRKLSEIPLSSEKKIALSFQLDNILVILGILPDKAYSSQT